MRGQADQVRAGQVPAGEVMAGAAGQEEGAKDNERGGSQNPFPPFPGRAHLPT